MSDPNEDIREKNGSATTAALETQEAQKALREKNKKERQSRIDVVPQPDQSDDGEPNPLVLHRHVKGLDPGDFIDRIVDEIDDNFGYIELLAGATPYGMTVAYPLPTAPMDWVFANGQECPDSPLRDELTAAGNPFGTVNGQPRVPNLAGRVVVGNSGMGNAAQPTLPGANGLNTTTGTNDGQTTLTAAQSGRQAFTINGSSFSFSGTAMGNHNHGNTFALSSNLGVGGSVGGGGGHNHTIPDVGSDQATSSMSSGGSKQYLHKRNDGAGGFGTTVAPDHGHSLSVFLTGGYSLSGGVSAASAGTPAGSIGGSQTVSAVDATTPLDLAQPGLTMQYIIFHGKHMDPEPAVRHAEIDPIIAEHDEAIAQNAALSIENAELVAENKKLLNEINETVTKLKKDFKKIKKGEG